MFHVKLQFRLDTKEDYYKALREHFGVVIEDDLTRIELMHVILTEIFKRDYNQYYSEIQAIINASIKQLKARSYLSVRGLRTYKKSDIPVEEKLIQVLHDRRTVLIEHCESGHELCPVRVAKKWIKIT